MSCRHKLWPLHSHPNMAPKNQLVWSKQCQGAYVQLLSTIWIKRNHLTFLYRVVSAPREACVQEVCYTGLIWLSRIAGSETFTAETSQNAVPSFCGVPQVRNFDEMFNWSKWFNLYFEFSSVPVTPHHRPARKTDHFIKEAYTGQRGEVFGVKQIFALFMRGVVEPLFIHLKPLISCK